MNQQRLSVPDIIMHTSIMYVHEEIVSDALQNTHVAHTIHRI